MLRRHPRHERDGAAAISGIDQRLRESAQALWLALPPERLNWDEFEQQFQRLSNRVLRDFKEDLEHFPPQDNGNSRNHAK